MLSKWVHKVTSKISTKIFLSTVSIVVVILLVQSLLYIFVIDNAQYLTKKNTLEKDFKIFLEDIKDKRYDLEYINLATRDYIKSSGNPVLVMRGNGRIYNETLLKAFTNIITVNADDQEYKIVFDEELLSKLTRDKLTIAAEQISENYYLVLDFSSDNLDFDAEAYAGENIVFLEQAQVIDYQFAPADKSNYYLNLYQEFFFLESQYKITSNHAVQSFYYEHTDVDATTIYNMTHYYEDNQIYYVLTSSTIIGLRDQLKFIASFNLFVFFIGLALAILLSKVISNTLSKPVIQLTENAKKMANLDFSQKTEINTHDEIGSLGMSLNTLSNQLEESVLTLKSKNKELEVNYRLKSIEEQRAKDLILHLSHELNTPLGIVSGFNEILADGINDKAPAYYHDAISNELERMSTLIGDMLELSVLEGGQYQLTLDDVDVNAIIYESLSHFKETFAHKDIKVNIELSQEIVKANFKKMHQVINNFISNASKYTEVHGEYCIYNTISEDKIYYYFVNTASIKVDDVSILWEKFYRTHKTNTRNENGSGIGLSIAKEILTLHESDFGITKGEDSVTFYFSLKRA
ncbi:HAMP domain-containing sensor histidine kinase [Fusibacter ferrireducens]|uniref:histidine kinase n=1 Tax=Fusibacter ferrireducens TaxID=2785058 RepID=A0ABR9ZYL1_9FIRM|nr:HAMP domain-containing sensor histidine kinase [Fusibacter ferrireducens]MBF4694669.1 HAMP domain-containing histidine kinase [Fusibacter ferrireducens]